ncbi:MAG TPA: nucleotide exchange factor GrpE [Sphingobacteriaceae bacterium]|nr:nucleotide exchange factor GrpE [Sphingobacteriaceae bacterium]
MEKNNNQKQEEFAEQSALDEQEVANTADQELQDSADASEASIEEKLVAELESAKDRYVRLYAEFDNYKRRTAKERVELMQSASKDVIGNLLTVLDDFDRAIKMMETATDVSAVKEGVELINQKFKNILTQQGLKEMSVMGQEFDSDFQEAITNVPAPSEDLKGKVIDEVEKGYFLHDKVLRYAKVVVGS